MAIFILILLHACVRIMLGIVNLYPRGELHPAILVSFFLADGCDFISLFPCNFSPLSFIDKVQYVLGRFPLA